MHRYEKSFTPMLAMLALAATSACSDDAEGSDTVDSGPTALMTLVQDEVELYDRRIRATCPCLVEDGVYETEQECLDLGLSRPDWAECATMALADYDSAQARADSQCFIDFLRETAECAEAAECDQDQLAICGTPDGECLVQQSERINVILTACPDFGLLSRLNP